MEALELLRNWPEFAKANAVRILASPAWRLETRYDGLPAVVRRAQLSQTPLPQISLSVSFEDASRIVTFEPSPLFPDLWKLREHLTDLPSEILLSLVEKECGALFQFFEDVGRRSFSIAGISESPATKWSFNLAVEGGEIAFTADLTPEMEQLLGQLANIDVAHETIRSLTREIVASYGALEMSDEEVAALKVGDCLLPSAEASPSWEYEFPEDALVRIVAPETRVATFAELADETLGPVPPGNKVKVCHRGREIATGVFAKLGEAMVVRIEGVGHER